MSVDSCIIVAEICTIKVGSVEAVTSSQSNDSTTDIDNHVNTTVLGSNCQPIHDFGISVGVSEWESSDGSVTCPIVSGAIAYDHPISKQVYMLLHHQKVHCPRLSNHLMYLMQSHTEGVRINEHPIF